MASIFTYEPDPPRVASPWNDVEVDHSQGSRTQLAPSTVGGSAGRLNAASLRLPAEPQEGPVEYKLHLLLRPRRKFTSISTIDPSTTTKHPSAPRRLPIRAGSGSETFVDSSLTSGVSTPSSGSVQQSRQHRLQQLTTQLLWRLQQSSPHHTSSASNFILPTLPNALPELEAPRQIGKLLHGLEESQGALYEIGVADEGTLVGLTEDEMAESLNNLRAMAACLGCTVEVLREEIVGRCDWFEDEIINGQQHAQHHTSKLIVAEALVKPLLQDIDVSNAIPPADVGNAMTSATSANEEVAEATEQMRVTLIGPTMSGKSTLLGTLTTSSLDNGRGQSRLSMLKHQHEISSGVTSSVTQELFGYAEDNHRNTDVINFASDNIASWIDIHVACSGNRLIFISDSAGHPRYRRTTVKGLIGWAPHWTLLCVPADDMEDSSGKTGSTTGSQKSLGAAVSNMDLSSAQLDLCLRLGQPLVIVITKLDLASRSGLRETLSKILDLLKAAGRKPIIMPNKPGVFTEAQLQQIPETSLEGAYTAALPLLNDPTRSVPIVLTSAVHGTGIHNLHAILNELPIPPAPSPPENAPNVLFHIEDVYRRTADVAGIVVSGYVRSGQISIGDTLTLGPFSTLDIFDESEDSDERPLRRVGNLPTSRSFPGAFKGLNLGPDRFHWPLAVGEWSRVKVMSIRNLRLPVHNIYADQVATLALTPDDSRPNSMAESKAAMLRVRKGMVLASIQPLAARTFVAEVRPEDLSGLAVGNHVVAYVASVRAAAKVVSIRASDNLDELHNNPNGTTGRRPEDLDSHDPDTFALDEDTIDAEQSRVRGGHGEDFADNFLITFRLDSSREFVPIGSKILIIPGSVQASYAGQKRGQKGMPGLEGYVGVVREVHG